MQSSIEDNLTKSLASDVDKTQYVTFSTQINQLCHQLYSAIGIELIKITQKDFATNVKAVLSANHIEDALQNEIGGLIDKYTTVANTVKDKCLKEISQHITAVNQLCQLKLNNSLDESKDLLNSLSNSIEKVLKDTQGNIKGLQFGFKALSTYTNNISEYIKKQKPSQALDKIGLSERMHNEMNNNIKEIKEGHDLFYHQTKGIFKQLREILDSKGKCNCSSGSNTNANAKSKSPNRYNSNSKSKGQIRETKHIPSSSSSYMNYKRNNPNERKSMNKTQLSSNSKDNLTSSNQYLATSENRVTKTISSNKSFHNTSSPSNFHSKSPVAKIDHSSFNDSIHQLKQNIKDLNKKNTELKSIFCKERTEKAFLFKEISRLNAEIEKYKEYGFTVNNAVSDIIKGKHIQKVFTIKDFNSQMKKITKISEMTMGFANSLSILQDSIIRKSSKSSIESRRLFDNLKRTLIIIVNDIAAINTYLTTVSGVNGQGYDDVNNLNHLTTNNNSENYNYNSNEEILQNEIFELKTQIAMINTQHIEEMTKMQKNITDNDSIPIVNNEVNSYPLSSSKVIQTTLTDDNEDNEINCLKKELKIKSQSESKLLKEINELKEKISNHNTIIKDRDDSKGALESLKQKYDSNIDQLKKIYQESIDSKDKTITNLNEVITQLKNQIDKLTSEMKEKETSLSSNLIQYEIDFSNSQSEKMQLEIILEESRSNESINAKKINELEEALNKVIAQKQANNNQNENVLSKKLQEETSHLNQKIIELTSLIESKDLIEQSLSKSNDGLKERLIAYESKEKEMELKLKDLTDKYTKERETTDSLVIDKMLLMQKNDDLNADIQTYSQRDHCNLNDIIIQTPKIYQLYSLEPITLKGKKFEWSTLTISNQSNLIEYTTDQCSSRRDKQKISKFKDEITVLKNKLKFSLEQNDSINQKIEEVEADFNREKEEYVGMLRVAFVKLMSEIQLTSKSKEFTTAIMRMLNYSDEDIFDMYNNSGKKKTLFGFLK